MAENTEEVSYDILEWFPILYCQEVFKYLSGRDVVQASRVNKEWYKFTAEKQQVAKFQLFFNDNYVPEEAKHILNNSKRNYQSIKFDGVQFTDSDFFSTFLENRKGSWKCVVFKTCQAVDEDTLSKILRTIEPTAENVLILQMRILDQHVITHQPLSAAMYEYFETQWTFPKLKFLLIQDYYYNIFKFFYGCKNLKKFEWYSCLRSAIHVVPILRNSRDLEVLTLDLEDWMLFEHVSEFTFKLQQLEIKMFPHKAAFRGLYSLLEAQAQTLKVVTVHQELNNECVELILSMQRLTTLTISLRDLRLRRALPVNETVVDLNLQDSPSQATFESFIRALPNLKNLHCDLNDEQFQFLFQAVPALESIESRFDISRLPDHEIFPNIKTINAWSFRWGMREPTGEYKFAAIVRKEMRVWFPAHYFQFDSMQKYFNN